MSTNNKIFISDTGTFQFSITPIGNWDFGHLWSRNSYSAEEDSEMRVSPCHTRDNGLYCDCCDITFRSLDTGVILLSNV